MPAVTLTDVLACTATKYNFHLRPALVQSREPKSIKNLQDNTVCVTKEALCETLSGCIEQIRHACSQVLLLYFHIMMHNVSFPPHKPTVWFNAVCSSGYGCVLTHKSQCLIHVYTTPNTHHLPKDVTGYSYRLNSNISRASGSEWDWEETALQGWKLSKDSVLLGRNRPLVSKDTSRVKMEYWQWVCYRTSDLSFHH